MQTIGAEKKFFRPKEASIFLGISLSGLWRHVAEGRIKTHKVSSRTTLISRDELMAFVSGRVA